nr:type I polyketide synthase [Colwellia psychrerythraea]
MAKKQSTSTNPVTKEEDEQTFNSRLQECPIAIVGMASIFADAKNLENYWDNIFESVDAIKEVPSDRWVKDDYYSSDPKEADKTYCKRGGFLPEIDFDPMEFGLPPNILELTDIAQLLSLVVAREVLNDAGIGDGSGYDRDKVGITLGVGGGQKQISPLTSRLQGPVLEKVLKASGVEEADRAMIIEKFKKAYIGWEENSFPGMLGNVISGRIANRFDFGGTNCVVDAACAGSLAAIKLAISDLLEHRSEVMISGGVCCDNSPFMYMSFSKTPAFTTGEDIRPFDNDSKGMMIGEGIGMMAFKRLEDAERDGDKVYAVLKGIGTSSDGRFKSIYAPRPDGQAKALKRAYEDAGFEPKSCGMIEAHGTGTKAGDAAEFGGLVKHFSQDNEQKQHIALGSVKSQIGHAKAAAGAAGMIKAVLALHHKVLPATLHIDQPNTALDIENSPMYLNSETRPWMAREDGLPRRAGISSFGFGGTNYHMVLEEYSPKAQGQYRLNAVPQTVLVTATDEKALVNALMEWKNKLSVNADDQPYAFNALVVENTLTTPAIDLARCGFVAKNADEAIKMIEGALKQFQAKSGSEEWSVPTGIYYRKSGLATTGKVVALFSGQGSQYVNMGRELACNFPSVMQAAADMDSEFSQAGLGQLSPTTYPIPVFNDDARKAQDEVLRLTQHAQPAIGTLSVGLYKAFTNAGFKADFTAGHSFGELTALWAAGVLSDSDYMMLARSRGQAMAAPTGEAAIGFDAGTMIAVVGNPAEVAEDIKDIKDISIANYNSNNQVVVAGVTSQIAIALDVLKGKGYKVVPLPVSAAFHTPLVGHAQKPFSDAIDNAKFNKPLVPVYSNGTAKAHSNKAAEIKKSLKNHILESVHFNEEIDNIYADGGRVFVEFGPKNVLTKLVENILKDKEDVVAIAVNANPKKSADMQMRQAAVQMAVLGLELTEIDPYSAVKRPLSAPKMSALAMKLTGASYVSPKTKKAFDDALSDGWTIKQATSVPVAVPEPQVVEKIVEKIVEVERIVEVEKIVYLNSDGSVADGTVANGQAVNNVAANVNSADIANSIERSVSQFVDHQQQLLNVHEQYMQGPKDYAKTFDAVLSSQEAGELPESLDRTLGMYHDFQSETLRVHEQYLNNQTENMAAMLSASENSTEVTANLVKTSPTTTQAPTGKSAVTQAPVVKPTTPVAPTTQPLPAAVSSPVVNAPVVNTSVPTQTVATAVAMSPVAEASITVPVQEPSIELETLDLQKIQTVMMEVVAEKTGYPTEMLELEMDMEADLGIDSIKRVEILGSVQEIIADLPELNPEDLAELRTLGEIVSYMKGKMKSKAQAAAPSASANDSAPALHLVETSAVTAPAIDLTHIQNVMMEVVAEKTGYPTEMLELEMDMEADLGIDSIKRVEILGSVQEIINDLPELNPEDLAELRTLGEIVSYMQSKVSAAPVAAVDSTPATVQTNASSAPAIDLVPVSLSKVQNVMMEVVAEKTGYPTEMLDLEMDMEADLGIDSIKRVEILGAVQETIPDLPELNPEDLAELRTLGEIVTYMQSKVTAAPVALQASAPSVLSNETQNSAPAIDLVPVSLSKVQNVMMEVVAEKTGYPTEMLELEMDMEADLGIDSIKRVEILGAVQETIPDLPELNPEDLAELRTLGEIVTYMQSKVSAAPVSAEASATANENSVSIDLDYIQSVMMTVVAEKTGYPTEMLELAMDMEADLGIDSIKRVEILGAVQETIPDLPELNPEDLAELRTLGEIVSYMQSKVSAAPVVVVDSAPSASANESVQTSVSSAPAIDLDYIQSVMMTVVAEKTGYPTEMLELAMDMEADLGIDSIKRVEILGAVQETIPDLPELNPEDLAELRTLGEIVSYMQSKVAPVADITVTVETSTLANDNAPAIDLDYIQKVMMEVVADKTGYPVEMLELAMDMEADLGIDSIKRVEILGAVQETIPDLPELNPEDLAELRTLGEIVSYMQSKVSPTDPTDPKGTGAKADVSAIDTDNSVEAAVNFQGAPSATVELTALSSVNKIVQDVTGEGKQSGANALVVDDGSGAAVALSAQLIKAGWQVTAIKPNWVVSQSKKAFAKAVNLVEIGTDDKTLDEAQVKDIIEKTAQLDAVIYLQAANTIDAIEYPEAAKQGLMLAFVLAKLSNVKNASKARASFVVVTRQGGTLGFANGDVDSGTQQVKANVKADLVQAGLAGLVKTINHEWNSSQNNGEGSVFCRIVDLSSKLAADKAATIINDELLDLDGSIVEVAHDTDNLSNNIGTRLTLSGVVTDSYALAPSVKGSSTAINSDSVFLVSGGAKGVTAHCVIEIAKQYQAKFILLGRSSFDANEPSWAQGISDEVALKKAAMQALIASGEKPTPVKVTQFVRPVLANREIAQTLTAIKAAGGQAHYAAADVTNSESVIAAVQPISKTLGQVSGIIHGAGVLADKFIEQKTLEEFNAVYTTKIDGLLSLLAATNAENIKHLVLFSSAAGFYGNPGQSDYSIANDILNKTAYRFKAFNPSTQVLSFNWGPWDGGMVTPELKRMFNDRGVYIIPLDAGAKLLVSELAADTNRCAQILVGNDLSKDKSKDTAKDASVKKPQVSRLTTRVNKTLLATNNTFLADHTIGDDKVFPTVCAIAWMSDAAMVAYPAFHYQGLANYKLFKGIIFDGSEATDYVIDMIAQVEGESLVVDTKISSTNEQGKPVFHYGAQLTLVAKAQKEEAPTVELILPETSPEILSETVTASSENADALYTNGTLFHGESLQGIKAILECNEQGLLLRCQVPEVASLKQGEFPISPVNSANEHANIFANDIAYQAMLVWVKKQLGLGSLPSSTDSWTVYRDVSFGENFTLKLTVVKSSGKGKQRGSLVADIEMIDENNRLLSEIKSAKVTASANLNDLFLPKEKHGASA